MKHAPPDRTPQYGSLNAAAERLHCSTRTVRRFIARGELTGFRLGRKAIRVDMDEVDSLLRRIPTLGGAA